MKNSSEVVGGAKAPSTVASGNESILLEDGLRAGHFSIDEDLKVESIFGAGVLVYAAGNDHLETVDTFIENARSPDDPIEREKTGLVQAADKEGAVLQHALPPVTGLSALSYSTHASGIAMQAAVHTSDAEMGMDMDMDMDMENRVETAMPKAAVESMDFSILAAWQEFQGNSALESEADRLGPVFLEEIWDIESVPEAWAEGEVMNIPENDVVPTAEIQVEDFNSAIVLFAEAENHVY